MLHVCQPRGKVGSCGWQRRLCAVLLGGDPWWGCGSAARRNSCSGFQQRCREQRC
jgi:hypothetical protein